MELQTLDLLQYIYIEYIFCVLILTEILKVYLPKPTNPFWAHPKWLTLFVGVGIAVLEAKYRLASPEGLDQSKLFISFGVTTLFYDYIIKIVKDLWTLAQNRLKKANDEVLAEDQKIVNPPADQNQVDPASGPETPVDQTPEQPKE
jgi:hypothetical protein